MRTRDWLVLIIVALLTVGCAKAPPNLSPAGARDFQNTRVIKTLDLIRDTAQDANAQTPPLVSTNTARTITQWHRSALLIIDATRSGWCVTVKASTAETFKNLDAAAQRLLSPYFSLASTLFNEVPACQ